MKRVDLFQLLMLSYHLVLLNWAGRFFFFSVLLSLFFFSLFFSRTFFPFFNFYYILPSLFFSFYCT